MYKLPPRRDSPDWYDWSERAAIREFDGGYSRDEAERLAAEDLRNDIAAKDKEQVD